MNKMNGYNQPNYQSWNPASFTEPTNEKQRLQFIARCGLLAPSVHNTQPWMFEFKKNQLVLTVQHQLHLPVSDKTGRGLFIAIGCCLLNMEIAANYLGYQLTTELQQSQPVKILVQLTQTKTGTFNQAQLFDSIFNRWSDKGFYLRKPIPDDILRQLKQTSKLYQSIDLTFVSDPKLKQEVADLYISAASKVSQNAAFAQEISQWVRANNTQRFDGMPGFVNGLPLLLSMVSSFVLKMSQRPLRIQAKADHKKLQISPVIGYFSSTHDSIKEWLEAGRAYELLQVTSIKLGLSCTPMQAIIEDEQMVLKLLKITKKNRRFKPQIFFRLGYSNNQEAHTPRRPLEYCLS